MSGGPLVCQPYTRPPQWRLAMVTAHRPQHLDRHSLPWIEAELLRVAGKLDAEHGCDTMLSGMAAGGDLAWAGCAEHMQVHLAAHVPFPQQPERWTDGALVDRYHQLLAYADSTGGITVYGDLPDGLDDKERKRRATGLLFKRNDGMLAATAAAQGVVVAVLRSAHAGGGTRDTYNKALGLKLPVIRVDPDRQTTVIASAGRPPVGEINEGTLL